MVTIALYAKQKKRHRCREQTLGLCGRSEGGMFRENSIETSILSRVKQTTSPGWMHETSAQGWCTGKTQRVGMGREVGGGIGMGNTSKSTADSSQCMAKPLQYCKVISLQLIKINEKTNKQKNKRKKRKKSHRTPISCQLWMEKELYSLVRVFLYSSSNNIVSRARKGSFGIFVQKDAETTVLFEH